MEEPVSVSEAREVKEGSIPLPEIHLPAPDIEEVEGEWEADGEGGPRRVKLIRSHAIRDSVSPPPPGRISPHSPPRLNSAGEGGGSGSDQRSIGKYRRS